MSALKSEKTKALSSERKVMASVTNHKKQLEEQELVCVCMCVCVCVCVCVYDSKSCYTEPGVAEAECSYT